MFILYNPNQSYTNIHSFDEILQIRTILSERDRAGEKELK